MLFTYGIGAVAGDIATGVLADRIGPAPVLLGAIVVQTALPVVLVLWREYPYLVLAAGFVWGIVSNMYLVHFQHRLLSHAGQASSLALAINSSLICAGIAVGALIGGVVLELSGLRALTTVSASIGGADLLAAAVFMCLPVPALSMTPHTTPAADGDLNLSGRAMKARSAGG